MNKISTKELVKYLDNLDSILIDIRPVAAYNGWSLKGEQRGGHISGAKSIPFQWTCYMDWVEVLDEKKITKNRPVILYGYIEEENSKMAEELCKLGFQKLFIYNNFVKEWAVNQQLPMERLPRCRQLVYPGWIQQLINDTSPPRYDNDHYVICHAHYDHPDDYVQGHIPEAIPLDTNSLESTETWNLRSPEELKKRWRTMESAIIQPSSFTGGFHHQNMMKRKFRAKVRGISGPSVVLQSCFTPVLKISGFSMVASRVGK